MLKFELCRHLEKIESHNKIKISDSSAVQDMYRRAHPFDLATHPFDLPQNLFYSETKDFRLK